MKKKVMLGMSGGVNIVIPELEGYEITDAHEHEEIEED